MSFSTSKLCERLVKYGKFFQMVPYMRAMILNGSLAVGHANEESDIYILNVTQNKRLYTCRFFMLLLAKCLGLRKGMNGPDSHAGIFCMTYFVVSDHLDLAIYEHELSGPQTIVNYAHGLLITGDSDLFKQYTSHLEKYAVIKKDQQAIRKYWRIQLASATAPINPKSI
jgi:hypothetical protein